MKKIIAGIVLLQILSCQNIQTSENYVISSDVDLFWKAFDQITLEKDSLRQIKLLDSLYLKKGSAGLIKIAEVKNYTAADYVKLINAHPKFWKSIRNNSQETNEIGEQLNQGIEKLRLLYPELRPAKIYFTIGAMRTNGTTLDSSVLIGSELAMADSGINITEFEGRTKDWLKGYFTTNPKENVVLLNIHEYVHTQQNKMPENLLHIVLYEGIAEFVSVKAMGVESSSPAINFGKGNSAVKDKFEKEMFYERTFDWLWSNSPNEFEVRDLGYYIGYSLAELHYEKTEDKKQAIKDLVELDYRNIEKVNSLIDETHFFSKRISELQEIDKKMRPKVISIRPFKNGSEDVDPSISSLTFQFSEALNGYNTGMNYSKLGEEHFPSIINASWSEDGESWTVALSLEASKHYKFYITENFRTEANIPLRPFLVEFKTAEE